MKHKFAMTVAAVMLTTGLVTLAGVGSAAAATIQGTIKCNLGPTSVTFTPALVATGTAKLETTKIASVTLSGCVSSIPGAPTGGTLTTTPITTSVLKGGNRCSAFVTNAPTTKFVFTIKWNNGTVTSKAVFKGAALSGSGFSLTGGTVTGSFATSTVKASAGLNVTPAQMALLTGCASGGPPSSVASIAVTGGSVTLGAGTVTCTSLSGMVTFSPPLVPGSATTTSEKVTIKPLKLASCTDSAGNAVPNPTAVAKVIQNTSNSCAVFAGNLSSDTIAFTATWKGSTVTTKVSFPPGTVSLGGTGFSASGGTATGRYATPSATFSVTVAGPDLTKLINCIGGSGSVTSISLVSGSSTL